MIKTIRNFIKKYKFYFLFMPIIGWMTPIYFLFIEDDDLDFWYHFINNGWLYFGSMVFQSICLTMLICFIFNL